MILEFNRTLEKLSVLFRIFITKTKTFQISPVSFKDKTKCLIVLKNFWKRNKTEAFGPKFLRTERKRFVSIHNFDSKNEYIRSFLEHKQQNVSFRSWKNVGLTLLTVTGKMWIYVPLSPSIFSVWMYSAQRQNFMFFEWLHID